MGRILNEDCDAMPFLLMSKGKLKGFLDMADSGIPRLQSGIVGVSPLFAKRSGAKGGRE